MNYYFVLFLTIESIFKCNYYFKSKFAREKPKVKDKITEVKTIPRKATTAFNLVDAAIFVFFRQFLKLATSNTRISVNIARKIKCYISKSKLILCEYNAFYFSEIAFIGFTLHEIKQGIVFFGTPGTIVVAIAHIRRLLSL